MPILAYSSFYAFLYVLVRDSFRKISKGGGKSTSEDIFGGGGGGGGRTVGSIQF